MNKNEIVIFETEDKMITLPVAVENETVWLNQNQMVELFERDQSVISRHIRNVFKEQEVEEKSNMHFLHIAQTVDKVGVVIIPSTTFLYIVILLPKILKSSRIPVF